MSQTILIVFILVSALIVGVLLAFFVEPAKPARPKDVEKLKYDGYSIQVNDSIIINGKAYRLVLISSPYATTPQLIVE
jgi:hypothetical protein